MKITVKESWSEIHSRDVDISDYTNDFLKSADPEQGKLEALQEEVAILRETFSRLVDTPVENRSLTLEEFKEVLKTSDKFEIRKYE